MAEGWEPNPSIARHSLGIVKGTNIFDDYLANGFAELNTVYIYLPKLESITTVTVTSLTSMMVYLGTERYSVQNDTSVLSDINISGSRVRFRVPLPSQYQGYNYVPIVIRLIMTVEAS